MTEDPSIIAQRPTLRSREVLVGDALSEVLHSIHLRGQAVSLHHGHGLGAPDLETDVRAIHIVEAGMCTLDSQGQPVPITLMPGDLALLPLGTPHELTGSDDAEWVSGIFEVDEAVAEPLLATLPPAITVHGSEVDRGWLATSLQLLRQELQTPRPGGQVMVSRILDLLLIHALRDWADSGHVAPGLLVAALDPALGRALVGMHRDPAHDWSVEELAGLATLSRSSFAARFTRLAGSTPVAYLAEVRLTLAAQSLLDTVLPVSQVAAEIGYTSEAAFSRAFHRRFDDPPGKWRREHGNSGAGK